MEGRAVEPIGAAVRLVDEDGLLVLDAAEQLEAPTDEQVRQAIELDRAERERRWT